VAVTAAARSNAWWGQTGGQRPVGWTSFALVVAGLSGSCASTPPRTPAQTVVDEAVASSVYTALNDDPVYFYRHVNVTVDDGIASLSGYVWSSDAIYRARHIARGVPGVTGVVTSHLELERNGFSYGPAR
jgi:osmotically-inducible protein OsmY